MFNDLKMMKINNWMKIVQNWNKWKGVTEKAKTLTVEYVEEKVKL